MADYKITPFHGGEFGIRVESDRAGNRSGRHNMKGMTMSVQIILRNDRVCVSG
jgi:hypothetical protein